MRKADVVIALASLSLVAIVGWIAFHRPADAEEPASVRREQAPAAEAEPMGMCPLQTMSPIDYEPQLGSEEQALRATMLQLRDGLEDLERKVAALGKEQERLASAVDPVADILRLLEQERPKFEQARARADETAAIATLRNVTSAQAQVQASARIDGDRDGTGEYGGFLEMSGAAEGRMTRKLVPPVLSRAFATLNDHGEAERSGYLYRFYLPDAHGGGIGEPARGFDSASGVDPDLAETTWCAYAWPAKAGASRRVYFMNQAGDVLVTEADYVGPGGGPRPDAAFEARGSITGRPAVGKEGADGNVWQRSR